MSQCPYCWGKLPADWASGEGIPPSRWEQAVWTMGHITEAVGIGIALLMILRHKHLEMSLLGACVGGLLAGGLIVAMGVMARRGQPEEIIGFTLVSLALFLGLIFYGLFALKPLDALGATVMLALGSFMIVAAERRWDWHSGFFRTPAMMRAYGFAYLGLFVWVYIYLWLHPESYR